MENFYHRGQGVYEGSALAVLYMMVHTFWHDRTIVSETLLIRLADKAFNIIDRQGTYKHCSFNNSRLLCLGKIVARVKLRSETIRVIGSSPLDLRDVLKR